MQTPQELAKSPEPALLSADREDRKTRRHGPESAPTEPPECARNQFLDRARFGRGVCFGEKGALNEVEVVKKADPSDSEEEVKPTEDHQQTVHDSVVRIA